MKKFNLGSLFGDRDLENMLSRVDNLTNTLSLNQRSVTKYNDNSSEALQDFLDVLKDSTDQQESGNINQMLQSITVPAQRTNRYMIYDEIYSSVQIVKSILKVYINNILQRDVITGKCIIYAENTEYKSNTSQIEKYKKFSQNIVNYFKLETQLNQKISVDLLKYGDHFIEIIDLKSDISDLPTARTNGDVVSKTPNIISSDTKLITESLEYINLRFKSVTESNKLVVQNAAIDSFIELVFEIQDKSSSHEIDISQANIIFEAETENKNKKDRKGKIDAFQESLLNRFVLRYHDPKKIVMLTTAHNNSVLGFVEIREARKMEITAGVGMQFASMIKQISAVSKDKKEDHSVIARKIVRRVIEKLVSKLDITKSADTGKTKDQINKEYEQQLYDKLGEDLFYVVKKLYIESDPQSEQQLTKVNVRFIPTDRMIHFCYNPNEYSPYGTSVIDALVYPGKLYLLSQLTNIVTKLSRAALIRKWTIETGPREHHTNLMQKLKRELRNQRISVDDIVSFKSIPKILSDFKDMILFTKKGQRFVDVDVQSLGDPNIKIADLEDTRRELIALSGVPAPYLGYNDVTDLRENLVSINISFATEIISAQCIINEGFSQLTDKIAKLLEYEEAPSKYVQPILKPPVILLLQMLEATMSSVANIQMSFQGNNVDFNPFYLLKKFITNIDWDEFSADAREYALFKKAQTTTAPPPDPTGGGGGGF